MELECGHCPEHNKLMCGHCPGNTNRICGHCPKVRSNIHRHGSQTMICQAVVQRYIPACNQCLQQYVRYKHETPNNTLPNRCTLRHSDTNTKFYQAGRIAHQFLHRETCVLLASALSCIHLHRVYHRLALTSIGLH